MYSVYVLIREEKEWKGKEEREKRGKRKRKHIICIRELSYYFHNKVETKTVMLVQFNFNL